MNRVGVHIFNPTDMCMHWSQTHIYVHAPVEEFVIGAHGQGAVSPHSSGDGEVFSWSDPNEWTDYDVELFYYLVEPYGGCGL